MNIFIDTVNPNDAEQIQIINKESLGYDYSLENTEKQIKEIMKRSGDRIFVARLNGKTVGYIHICDYICTYVEKIADIKSLAVSNEYKNLGIGRLLLEEAEKWVKSAGLAGIRLTSGIKRTGAHEFYKRCGYESNKESRNFFKLF